jgi:hypothetical protein
MGIREKLNQHRNITIGATCAVILLAIGLLVWQTRGASAAGSATVGGKLFFTTDDGKTWFIDDAKNIPPYMKNGKEAVRAYVYRTGDGKEFVGFLERYSPAGKKTLDAAMAKPAEQQMEDPFLATAGAVQWKKPGEATWVSVNDPRAEEIAKVVSPKGAGDPVSVVAPTQ